jgi:hypothetical protein
MTRQALESWNSFTHIKFPFLAMLNMPNLMNLTNDIVLHHPNWPLVPTKVLSNILKFEGKVSHTL